MAPDPDRRGRGSPPSPRSSASARSRGPLVVLAALPAAVLAIGGRPAAAPPAVPALAAATPVPPGPETPAPSAEPGRAGFRVAFRDVVSPFRVLLLTALPGERVPIRALPDAGSRSPLEAVSGGWEATPSAGGGSGPGASGGGDAGAGFTLRAAVGSVERVSGLEWAWTAPSRPGYYPIVLRRGGADSVLLTGAVMVPRERLRGGRLDGYRLGAFPREPYRGLPQYEPPRGFLLLRPEHADVPVSPHLTLGQFPAKGPPGYPKYLVLGEKLLVKLELLLEEARRRGVPASGFEVLSGFRSPWYNAGIGRPLYSRHVYGDAADIYVDEDGDGRMDDLNGDGRIDVRDADVLYRIVEEMDGSPDTGHLVGGLGKYRVTPNHGPFIHVDTREYRARW